MNNLYNLLQKIKENPVLYLGKPSITCLHLFLNGYLDARKDLGLDREGSGFEGFQEWVYKRAKTDVCQSWAGIILFGSGSERGAFYRFFVEYEQFLNDKSSTIQENKSEEKSRNTEDNLNSRQFDVYKELLGSIKKRPGMYLGTGSITRLDMLLRGYSLAQREVGIPPNEHEREFEDFQSWIQRKYGINSGQSWAKIILFYSIDEKEALVKFFELFEEYLNWNKSSEADKSRVGSNQ